MTDRATYPDTLLPSRLAAGEDYASASAILAFDDRPTATIHIPHWGGAAIRVRAPSLADMEQIGQAAPGADQYITTIRLCCVLPAFNAEQAEQLRDKSAQAVEQIARFIWVLGTLDHDWIARVVQTETPAETERPAAAGPAAKHPRVRTPVRAVA